VVTYDGGFNRSTLSAAFGTNLGSDDINDCSTFNSVLKLGNGVQQFCVLFDGLYESTDSGATFSQVFAFTLPTADLTRRITHGGLHIAYDKGSQQRVLGGWFASSTGFTLTGWTYNLTTFATSETNQAYGGSGDEICGSELLYGTAIHFNYGTGVAMGNLFSFDLVSQSWADFTIPVGTDVFTMAASCCYAVGSDGALYLACDGSVGGVNYGSSLWRFTGSWAQLGMIHGPFNDNAFEAARDKRRIALFSDGLDLQCVTGFAATTSKGWRHYTITSESGFDPTVAINRTTTADNPSGSGLVPADLRVLTDDSGTANNNSDKRCIVVQDTQSTPGTLETYLAFSDDSNPGSPYSLRKYEGIATLPQASRNGGGYFFTAGQDGVEILDVSPADGGETISFIAYGGGTVTVQFRRGAKQQGAVSIATLFGSATGGGTRSGNQVTGVTADGTTVNTVPWNFFADSFANSEANAVLVAETA
jgi:hypothetical protein